MSLTREDLHMGLHRFATKHDLDRFATRQDVADLREATAHGFEDLRRQIDLVAGDLTTAIGVLLDRLAARSQDTGTLPARGQSDGDRPRGLDERTRSD
jgi:hypothetical protein